MKKNPALHKNPVKDVTKFHRGDILTKTSLLLPVADGQVKMVLKSLRLGSFMMGFDFGVS